ILAYDYGSVREVIDEGVTGNVVGSLDEAIATLPKVLQLDRGEVRRRFEKRFSARRMGEDYVRIYQMLLRRSRTRPSSRSIVDEVTRVNGDKYLSDAGLQVDKETEPQTKKNRPQPRPRLWDCGTLLAGAPPPRDEARRQLPRDRLSWGYRRLGWGPR